MNKTACVYLTVFATTFLALRLSHAATPALDASAKKLAERTSAQFDDRTLLKSRIETDDVMIDIPAFFDVTLFAKLESNARHLVVRNDGAVYVRVGRRGDARSDTIVALQDTDNDRRADVEKRFGGEGGTGIEIHDGYLFYSTTTDIYRRKFKGQELVPLGREELVVSGLPQQSSHAAKPLVFDGNDALFTTVGAPSNACMKEARTKGSPGLQPCPQLAKHGAIWRFSASKAGQPFASGKQRATGLRQVVALAWSAKQQGLFAVQHGRDQLHELFPDRYTARESAELPAEEFLRLDDGFVGGWPYTYYDWRNRTRMVAPEYGGDGQTRAPTDKYPEPVAFFPGHYAPNDLVFYEGGQFPPDYQGAAFVALHGSWNRAPFSQRGYHVAVVHFHDGQARDPKVFMDGFAGSRSLASPRDAKHRPMGLAVGPEGELYVSDSVRGFIWRVDYLGE